MSDIKDADPVTIAWRRNIPADMSARREQAGMAKGVLSDETILELFPADVVPDKQAELDRLASQAETRLPAITTEQAETQE